MANKTISDLMSNFLYPESVKLVLERAYGAPYSEIQDYPVEVLQESLGRLLSSFSIYDLENKAIFDECKKFAGKRRSYESVMKESDSSSKKAFLNSLYDAIYGIFGQFLEISEAFSVSSSLFRFNEEEAGLIQREKNAFFNLLGLLETIVLCNLIAVKNMVVKEEFVEFCNCRSSRFSGTQNEIGLEMKMVNLSKNIGDGGSYIQVAICGVPIACKSSWDSFSQLASSMDKLANAECVSNIAISILAKKIKEKGRDFICKMENSYSDCTIKEFFENGEAIIDYDLYRQAIRFALQTNKKFLALDAKKRKEKEDFLETCIDWAYDKMQSFPSIFDFIDSFMKPSKQKKTTFNKHKISIDGRNYEEAIAIIADQVNDSFIGYDIHNKIVLLDMY